ncbi:MULTISPECIES: hypothetical protein [Clostridium]|jgi:hypothetical protein|uniref:Uncharacterized protein n=1 Tax=bioreactor metagenome TaxID=1076179 RepID=A0A644XII1_9ZZZZ|nr:hypothetical protein [Clostridium sp. C8]KLE15195.1 hypothetical protein AAT22_11790 [Clostridium sp. C8]
MIKKLSTFFILAATLINFSKFNIVQADDVKNKGNAFRVSNNISIALNKDKFDDFWTPKNEGYLDASQKEKLNILREKINNGETLNISEKNELKNMKAEIIKLKLGDAKFQELQKLIEKREGATELTLPERQRLYELNKEARG